ncbi:Smt3-specific protease [Loxospora ochrophaea]|nr:Smt3-specific protease [Loxospora ochrophaea]
MSDAMDWQPDPPPRPKVRFATRPQIQLLPKRHFEHFAAGEFVESRSSYGVCVPDLNDVSSKLFSRTHDDANTRTVARENHQYKETERPILRPRSKANSDAQSHLSFPGTGTAFHESTPDRMSWTWSRDTNYVDPSRQTRWFTPVPDTLICKSDSQVNDVLSEMPSEVLPYSMPGAFIEDTLPPFHPVTPPSWASRLWDKWSTKVRVMAKQTLSIYQDINNRPWKPTSAKDTWRLSIETAGSIKRRLVEITHKTPVSIVQTVLRSLKRKNRTRQPSRRRSPPRRRSPSYSSKAQPRSPSAYTNTTDSTSTTPPGSPSGSTNTTDSTTSTTPPGSPPAYTNPAAFATSTTPAGEPPAHIAAMMSSFDSSSDSSSVESTTPAGEPPAHIISMFNLSKPLSDSSSSSSSVESTTPAGEPPAHIVSMLNLSKPLSNSSSNSSVESTTPAGDPPGHVSSTPEGAQPTLDSAQAWALRTLQVEVEDASDSSINDTPVQETTEAVEPEELIEDYSEYTPIQPPTVVDPEELVKNQPEYTPVQEPTEVVEAEELVEEFPKYTPVQEPTEAVETKEPIKDEPEFKLPVPPMLPPRVARRYSNPYETPSHAPSKQRVSARLANARLTTTDPPATPSALASGIRRLSLSDRRSSDRRRELERLESKRAAEKLARQQAIEAAERSAREAAETLERRRNGIRRIPTLNVIAPLSDEWNTKVTHAMESSDRHVMASLSTGTHLTRRDFGTLLPQPGRDRASGWLNDDIINGYLQHVVDYGLKEAGQKRTDTPRYHAFNSFFYANLREKGPTSVWRWAKRARVGGENLEDVERIFIPVHQGSHWTLLVISPMYRTIEYFDSLGGGKREFVDKAKEWLEYELGERYVEEEWKVLKTRGPLQNNGMDCGVFTVTTAKMILLDVDPMSYGAGDIPLQRRRMVAEMMNGGFDGEFRPEF